MSKKIRIFLVLVATVLLMQPMVFTCAQAAEHSPQESYKGPLTVIPDETTPPQVSYGGYTPAIPLNPLARSTEGPVYYFQSEIGIRSASCYSESWNHGKTERYPIDEIIAEVSVYEYGSHVADRRDEHRKSYTAKASYSGKALSIVVEREAYGYHSFKMSGYQTIEEETYAGV